MYVNNPSLRRRAAVSHLPHKKDLNSSRTTHNDPVKEGGGGGALFSSTFPFKEPLQECGGLNPGPLRLIVIWTSGKTLSWRFEVRLLGLDFRVTSPAWMRTFTAKD